MPIGEMSVENLRYFMNAYNFALEKLQLDT